MTSKEHKELLSALKKVVEASNRTNHAVRAIVLPSTIILIAVIVAVPLLLLSLVVGAAAIVLAGIVLLVGSVAAIAAQLGETKLSEIPGARSYAPSPQEMKSASEFLPEEQLSVSPQVSASSGECRFCGKPFAPGVYDSCSDCGKN